MLENQELMQRTVIQKQKFNQLGVEQRRGNLLVKSDEESFVTDLILICNVMNFNIMLL